MKLYVGAAGEVITPEVGGHLYGYNSGVFSDSVHDDLTVKAIALCYGSTKVLLISATVCLINNALCDRIRGLVGGSTGVPAANVIINATHTHSGPAMERFNDKDGIDTAYCEAVFIPKCLKACKTAIEALKPARMGIASVESLTGINRRQILRDGKVTLGQNPWGAYDPLMTVISFKDGDGSPIANIIHFGAHCTSAGINHKITRDWEGVMTDRLTKESGALTAFFSGAGGDIAPRMSNGHSRRGDISHVLEVGAVAAMDAVRAFRNIRAYYDEDMSVACGDICIPYEPVMPPDKIDDEIERFEKLRMDKSTLYEAKKMHETGGTGATEFVFHQTVVRIGPVVFIPFPFETFSEISRRLRAYSPYGHTLVLGCTNGSNSYLPTQDQITRGGYEVDSFLWAKPRQLPNDTDTRLINENLNIMEEAKNAKN